MFKKEKCILVLSDYRAREGLWCKLFVWKNIESINPIVWWKCICSSKLLSKVAVRILTAPCIERAAKISFISYNWNLLHKHEEESKEDEDNFSLSPACSTTSSTLNVPSTSQNATKIEFLDVNTAIYESDSDSD
ncbi:hypothetical protein ACJJTC_015679 [Scirpophaga incertulas]